MKKLLYLLFLVTLVTIFAPDVRGQAYYLRMMEEDGVPNQTNVRTIVVPNGSLDCGSSTSTICHLTFTGTGGAPVNASYLVLSLNSSLTQERILTAGNNIQFVDTGANGTLTIKAQASSPAFSLQYNNGSNLFAGDDALTYDSTTASLIVGKASTITGKVLLHNNGGITTLTLSPGATSSSYTWTFPSSAPGSTQCLQISNTGAVTATGSSCGTGGGVNAGTTPRLGYYATSGSTISDTPGLEYRPASSPMVLMDGQTASDPVLVVRQSTASSTVPTIGGSPALVTLQATDDNTYWLLGFVNDSAPRSWATYVTDDGYLYLQTDNLANTTIYSKTGGIAEVGTSGQGMVIRKSGEIGASNPAIYSTGEGVGILGLSTNPIDLTSPTNILQWDSVGVVVNGKLTVTGAIDPTSIRLSSGTNLYYESADGSTAGVSAANEGRLRYNSGTQTWQASMNGASYADIATGSITTSWNSITDPSGNLALTMASNTSTFSYDAGSGANDLWTLQTASDGSGAGESGYLFALRTPGVGNTKKPIGVYARGNLAFEVEIAGAINAPGAGTASTRLGSSSLAGGDNTIAIGVNASAPADSGIAIGKNANSGAGVSNIMIGRDETASGTGQANVVIGAFGGSNNSAGFGIGMGYGVSITADYAMAFGRSSSASADPSIAFGYGATANASGDVVFGSDSNVYANMYLGRGKLSAAPSTFTINTTGGNGADVAGAALNIAAGKSTGNAVPGRVHLQAGAIAASSSTAQTLIDRYIIGAVKILADNTNTAIVNATIANDSSIAGFVDYSVEAIDGSHNVQIESGSFMYQVTNTNGTIANNTITFPTGYPINTTTSGTLAVTWTITAANPAVLKVNADTSLTPSTGYPRVTYTLRNVTNQAVAVQ